ncbi:hypothetical protein H9L25_06730 [Terrisporobacter mayombei]|nr:hypothetical protein [Terrisporobacter mayombei]
MLKGIETIKNLEKKDVLESEEQIKLVQSSLQNNKPDINSTNQKVDYIDKFSNSLIMGDSRAESISVYGILNNSSVIAYKGRNLATAIKNGDINKAVNLSPKNIFLTYGMNDITVYGNSDDFIKEYEIFINKLQDKLPNSKIYVNSIFRVSNKALPKSKSYSNISKFNIALEDMCNRLGITYIDASSCVKENLFEKDGIHFKPQFSKDWLNLLIQKANL